jgi:hypothetical protein
MRACLKYVGNTSNPPSHSNYTCRPTASGYCAENLSTGQCTFQFTRSEYRNPKAACEKYLRNR